MPKLILVILIAALLSACKHTPPLTAEGAKCDLVRYSIEQPLPGEKDIASVLGNARGDMLFLSGGSQNGAFGAGFLQGWHESSAEGLPEFSVVTGISTGALQATGAFIGRPDITVEGYTINSEADLLETYVSGESVEDGLGFGPATTALRRGALSDLVPLQSRLDIILTPDVLARVAARYGSGATGSPRLLVGATDFDLGQAVAFDMTELAHRYVNATDPTTRDRLKDCYIRALVASSIVPGAAKPMFIDNRMYIDGGVRFAVFDDRVGEILTSGPERLGTSVYMIFNSDGEPKTRCGKVDDVNCVPIESTVGQHEDWDFLSLVFGTVDMLVDQVQRLSIDRARSRASELSADTYFARIRTDDLGEGGTEFTIPDFTGAKTCDAWEKDDDRLDAPLEFHRRYMRCLIEYGKQRGRAGDWDFRPRR